MQALQRIFSLVKKTGDRCIIVSEDGSDAHVVLSFDDYEHMVMNDGNIANLTEEELLSRINRDIAVWKNQQESTAGVSENSSSFEGNKLEGHEEALENDEYLANNSENSTYSRYWEEEDEDDYEDDEPYYFEQVS